MRAYVVGNYMNANFLQVDRLPQQGESLAATGVFQEHGGKGLNLALGLHRLGACVDLLMAVGCDTAGEAVKDQLAREGLSLEHVISMDVPSGYGVGFIAPDGSNFLAAYQGANALLDANHVVTTAQALRSAKWVLAQFEIPDEPVIAAFRLAKEAGARTFLNPSPWRPIPPEMLSLTDTLVVNQQEAACLLDCPEAAHWPVSTWIAQLPGCANVAGLACALLVVTLAEQGCVALSEGQQTTHCKPYAVTELDATGAGDAFGAGLVWALLERQPLPEALAFANACGAMVAAQKGIWDFLPRAADVAAFQARKVEGQSRA